MAATVTVTKTVSLGGTEYMYEGTIAFDSSYPTGGEAIDAGQNERLDRLYAGGGTTAQGLGYVFNWNPDAQSLVVTWGNAGSASVLPEFTSTGDLSALTAVPFIAWGQ